MINFPSKDCYGWEDLLAIVRDLRSPDGCPWDRVQTHGSIRRNFLEETYEALDAIDRDDAENMREELGDVLLQVAFHARMEEERGRFDMADVTDALVKKLLYRHPHVFGGAETAKDGEQALANWEARKRAEKGFASVADAVESVPHTLPALWRAEKIQKKAAKAGFEWENAFHALEKAEEELGELREAMEKGGAADAPHGVREEAGDVLFMTVCVLRMYGIDPEDALHRTCDKFERRFRGVEELADKPLSEYAEAELVELWTEAKRKLSATESGRVFTENAENIREDS